MPDKNDQYGMPLDKWHITLLEMMDAVANAFALEGKPQFLAETEARIAVNAIYKTFRGSQLYIPFSAATERAFLHAQIFAEFDGKNIDALARKYETSIQNIYRIIKRQREIKRIEREET